MPHTSKRLAMIQNVRRLSSARQTLPADGIVPMKARATVNVSYAVITQSGRSPEPANQRYTECMERATEFHEKSRSTHALPA